MKTSVMFSSNTDQWATPQEFFDELDAEFHFTLDPCADASNTVKFENIDHVEGHIGVWELYGKYTFIRINKDKIVWLERKWIEK